VATGISTGAEAEGAESDGATTRVGNPLPFVGTPAVGADPVAGGGVGETIVGTLPGPVDDTGAFVGENISVGKLFPLLSDGLGLFDLFCVVNAITRNAVAKTQMTTINKINRMMSSLLVLCCSNHVLKPILVVPSLELYPPPLLPLRVMCAPDFSPRKITEGTSFLAACKFCCVRGATTI